MNHPNLSRFLAATVFLVCTLDAYAQESVFGARNPFTAIDGALSTASKNVQPQVPPASVGINGPVIGLGDPRTGAKNIRGREYSPGMVATPVAANNSATPTAQSASVVAKPFFNPI